MSLIPTFLRLVSALVALVAVIFIAVLFGEAFDGWQPSRGRVSETLLTGAIPFEIVDGMDVGTGLIYARGFELVKGNCTNCHSAKLITQNRATRPGWQQMIRWMQETQGLWPLGQSEAIILDYLAENYAPVDEGRRPNLDVKQIEWYVLPAED